MATVSEEQVREALRKVVDPDRGADVVSLGMISGLVVKGGNVGFAIEIAAADGARKEPLRKACEAAVQALSGVVSTTAVLTAERADTPAAAAPAAAQARTTPRPAPGAAPPGVGAIVAVASGKGGVGKSTTAINLAVALARQGHAIGLLDADIYGPSVPRLTGLRGRKPTSPDGKTLEPMEAFGVRCMSMGFLVDEDTPMIWRGPMVQGALEQLLREVRWGTLDMLVVDMPPGTGDAQLTMAQRVPLAGAIIVSTPQDLALLDARKGLNMFRKVDVPVLGLIENMSYFICPACGAQSDIFGHGGARAEATRLDLDFLGEIPLDIAIRTTSDEGTPIVAAAPESAHARAYLDIAQRVWSKLGSGAARQGPRIVRQ